MKNCHDSQCSCIFSTPSVHQTLDELEFERGIWKAALDDDCTRIGLLLDRGQDVNIKDVSGYTALHYAARQGNFEVVRLLLLRGANANATTRAGGLTALHRSAHQGHLDIVQLLLDHKATPDICDTDGKTPLHKAAENDQLETCKLLIYHCPLLKTISDKKGRKAIDITENKLLKIVLSEE